MYPRILDLMYGDIKEGKKNISGEMSKGTYHFWKGRLNRMMTVMDEAQRELALIGFMSETIYQQNLDEIYHDFENALKALEVWKKDGDI